MSWSSIFQAVQLTRIQVMLFIVVTTTCGANAQLPSWADRRLPVKDGVLVWLDAAAIPKAAQAAELPQIADGDRLARWFDASGNQRDFVQAKESDQPKLIQIDDGWSVRFDGESDHLRCVTVPGTTSASTILIVAAPHSNHGDYRGFFATNAAGERDYQSGLTIDLGRAATPQFEQLNVEGLGFGGERDLLDDAASFGTLHTRCQSCRTRSMTSL